MWNKQRWLLERDRWRERNVEGKGALIYFDKAPRLLGFKCSRQYQEFRCSLLVHLLQRPQNRPTPSKKLAERGTKSEIRDTEKYGLRKFGLGAIADLESPISSIHLTTIISIILHTPCIN